MTSPAKRARLADVAARAGVSATAASLVLNNVPGSRISEETRTRIFESAEALMFSTLAMQHA